MEADWSVEVGSDLPVIVVPWDGFVDLRLHLDAVDKIAEVANNRALAEALIKLNATDSPVFTSKCDLWSLAEDEIDVFEFDASREEAQQGIACYIDIIAHSPALFASFAMHETWVRHATFALRAHLQPQARAEFVIRPALYIRDEKANAQDGFAITLYVSACAATEIAAKSIFQAALQTTTAFTIKESAVAGE